MMRCLLFFSYDALPFLRWRNSESEFDGELFAHNAQPTLALIQTTMLDKFTFLSLRHLKHNQY